MIRVLALSVSALALSGCISLLPEPPPAPAMFVLEAGDIEAVQGAPIDAVIGVTQPEGSRAPLGPDLVWRTGDTLAYVAQSQWSGRADEALQAMLVRTFQGQRRFRAAVRAGEARSDYMLRWDIVSFEVAETDLQARFVADVMLLGDGRRVVASERISAEAPVSDRAATAAANALARAAREGSARIAVFAADAATQDQARAAAEDASRQGGVDQ